MVAILGFSMNPASTQAVHVGLIMQTIVPPSVHPSVGVPALLQPPHAPA